MAKKAAPARKPNLELTSIEKEALLAYKKHIERFGTNPSVRQLGALIGLGHNGAHSVLGRLRDKGYLAEKPVTIMRLKVSPKGKKV